MDELKLITINEEVAIPSNRVNVSYLLASTLANCPQATSSQSPQIGSMFLTVQERETRALGESAGRNPLKSGQCFLREVKNGQNYTVWNLWGRNPLKSGQCFLRFGRRIGQWFRDIPKSQSPQIGSMFLTLVKIELKHSPKLTPFVAIPSNRVNVSYKDEIQIHLFADTSQSPQIGSMFLTEGEGGRRNAVE